MKVRRKSGFCIILGVLGLCFLWPRGKPNFRQPSSEIEDSAVSHEILESTWNRIIYSYAATSSVWTQKKFGVAVAVASLLKNTHDQNPKYVDAKELTLKAQSLNWFATRSFSKLVGQGYALSNEERRQAYSKLLEAISTLKMAVGDRSGPESWEGELLSYVNSSQHLQSDVSADKVDDVLLGFEEEVTTLMPAVFDLAWRRAETSPDFRILVNSIVEDELKLSLDFHPKVKPPLPSPPPGLTTSFYDLDLKMSNWVEDGNSRSLNSTEINQMISELLSKIWGHPERQKLPTHQEIEAKITQSGLELYVVSGFLSAFNPLYPEVTRRLGALFLSSSLSIVRVRKDNFVRMSQRLSRDSVELLEMSQQMLRALRSKSIDGATIPAHDELLAESAAIFENHIFVSSVLKEALDRVLESQGFYTTQMQFYSDQLRSFFTRYQKYADEVDPRLNETSLSVLQRLNDAKALFAGTASSDSDLHQLALLKLSNSVSELDQKFAQSIEDAHNNSLSTLYQECINFDSTSFRQKMSLDHFQSCLDRFSIEASHAANSPEMIDDPRRSYDSGNLAAELAKPLEPNFGFLSQLASSLIVDSEGKALAPELGAYGTLGNPIYWAQASHGMVKLAERWPDHIWRVTDGPLAQTLQQGENFSRFSSLISKDPAGQFRPQFLAALLDRYDVARKAFFAKFDDVTKASAKRLPSRALLWSRDKHDLKRMLIESQASFPVEAQVPACTDSALPKLGTLSGKNLKIPLSMIEDYYPYFAASYLGVGKISVCVDHILWHPAPEKAKVSTWKTVGPDTGRTGSLVRITDGKSPGVLAQIPTRTLTNRVHQSPNMSRSEAALAILGDSFELNGMTQGNLELSFRVSYQGPKASDRVKLATWTYQSLGQQVIEDFTRNVVLSEWQEASANDDDHVFFKGLVKDVTVPRDVKVSPSAGVKSLGWPGLSFNNIPETTLFPVAPSQLDCLSHPEAVSPQALISAPQVEQDLCAYFKKERELFATDLKENVNLGQFDAEAKNLAQAQMMALRFIQLGLSQSLVSDATLNELVMGSVGLQNLSTTFLDSVVTQQIYPPNFEHDLEINSAALRLHLNEYFSRTEKPNEEMSWVASSIEELKTLHSRQVTERKKHEQISQALEALSSRVTDFLAKSKKVSKATPSK